MTVFRMRLRKKLERVRNLPSLPPIVMKINSALSDKNASADKIANIIAGDQSLSTSILRVANSAYYSSVGHSVSTISEAVVRLGLDGVRELCTTMAIIKEFARITSHINYRLFWKHSIATAHAAGIILEWADIRDEYSREQAYTAGLIHDIGLLIMTSYFMGISLEVWKEARRRGVPYYVAESDRLKVDHGEVGGYLLRKWNLPPVIVTAVSNHHHSESMNADERGLTVVVELAESMNLAGEFIKPFHGRVVDLREGILEDLGISQDDLVEIEKQAMTEAEKTEKLLMIGGDTVSKVHS
jgi:putative nucleotidyltransferase with HDIG domain